MANYTEDDFQRELNAEKAKIAKALRKEQNEQLKAHVERTQQETNRNGKRPIQSTRPSPASATPEDSFEFPEDPAQKKAIAVSRTTAPEWYTKLDFNSSAMKRYFKQNKVEATQATTALSSLRSNIDLCEQTTDRMERSKHLETLRDDIHKAEFLAVDRYIVRRSGLMGDNGFRRIINDTSTFPWDLRADTLQLYNRWWLQIFSIDLLRGIIVPKSSKDKRNADRIDPSYPKGIAKVPGQGDLVVGQWWPTQLCTVRDGAHGSPQAGIYGEKGKGAYSIVLSGGTGYQDEDNGDEIWYSGTDSKNSTPTENTWRMIESCDKHPKQPVRVIRSWNQPKSNSYRPQRGYRYDGLYEVVDKQVLNPSKAMYRFLLKRIEGQDPIRYQENAARRPTKYEVKEYDKLRQQERGLARDDW
ncbi:PUA-like domain-containing protein [Clohesyomyces aquaticus]|uniref:PUA-like domain-containing protein n=1 Tax=Clohesyomyces aquaticus TaxID=1231657 RepID=A0A1Y1ZRJ8_9PLEO|nr:PUA-like domain-containing protein [Clohesyomyces aquaticus]